MDKDYFYFKNFKLRNRDTALKINTDGVLLAAWVDAKETENILDVGTGGGVIAFILAYKYSQRNITGIDICAKSIEEAKYNKHINPAIKSISFYTESFQEHCSKQVRVEELYDHIVSNPPFFEVSRGKNPIKSPKQRAKHSYDLSFEELLENSYKLLKPNGKLSIIIDYRDEGNIAKTYQQIGFTLSRKLLVSGKPSSAANRLLLELMKGTGLVNENRIVDKLSIRNDDGSFTSEYKMLTKDWYLNF